MHELGEESRRRSYATVILTVDAILNMYTYMRHVGKRGNQRLFWETGVSSVCGWYRSRAIPVQDTAKLC